MKQVIIVLIIDIIFFSGLLHFAGAPAWVYLVGLIAFVISLIILILGALIFTSGKNLPNEDRQ